MIVSSAVLCLALNIFHEARGELVPGQYAVALVTMNRAGQDDRVCQEVFRPKQFSWTTGVRRTAQGWKLPKRLIPQVDNPIEAYSWNKAQRIAAVTLSRGIRDLTQGADHYHADYVTPRWAAAMEPVRQIGRHIFYRAKVSQH